MAVSGGLAGRRVLVTGASGFIGRALVRALLAEGALVSGVSRTSPPIEDGLAWWMADLTDADEMRRVVQAEAPEVVFHLASHVTGSRDLSVVPSTLRANLLTTVDLLTLLAERGCDAVVLAGSMEEPLPGEETPGSPYAAAKWASTGYARMFHALYGLPVSVARIFMTYGPDQPDRKKLVPYVTDSLLRGESPRLTSGEREVDWVYVDDVVRGLIAMACSPDAAGEVVDLGSGNLASVRKVAERLAALVSSEAAPEFGALATRPLEHTRVADVAATEALVGWRPSVALDEGLARTVEWHRAEVDPGTPSA